MRRRSVFVEYCLLLLVLILGLFVLLNTLGTMDVQKKLIAAKEEQLYEEAERLANSFVSSLYQENVSLEDVYDRVNYAARITETRIWILNKYSGVTVDTESNTSRSAVGMIIDNEYPGFLNENYISNFVVSGVTKEPMICVTVPMNVNFEVKGYVSIMMPISDIFLEGRYYTDFVNRCFLVFVPILIVVFILAYSFAIVPVNRMTKQLKAYFEDNCKGKLDMKYPAEISEMGGVVRYMGEKLNNFDETQRKFLSNVSHDFRSPLTSIRGYLEAMKDGTIGIDEQGKYFDILLYETDRLTKLTSNILQLNNIDDNGLMLNKTVFDVNAMIKQIALTFEGTFQKKKLVLNLIFSQKESLVEADADRIQQVIYNLLDNAVKFSGTDSSIRITTEERGNKVYVAVKDFGAGIPKESINRVFERFYKSDSSRGRDKKGSGLGLSIVKEILKAHDQDISVVSTEGVGTEFTFSLKAAE